jgi:hypothetical protein
MTATRRACVAGWSSAAVALAGCPGLGARGTATTRTSKLQAARATHEYPTPASAPEASTSQASTPDQAIGRFAGLYINWTPDTVAEHMRELAAESVGQARSAMQLAAVQTANDYELQRGGVANTGTVEAIAPLHGRSDEFVVVTRETTTATNTTAYQGLRPAWHVAIATVEQTGAGRWALSGWQPEN